MPILPTIAFINEVEDCYAMPGGSRSLGTALQMLQTRWAANCRDRETALRLAFLAWYTEAEPTFLTGLPENQTMIPVFEAAAAALGGADCIDPEACCVIGMMAELCPYFCGDEQYWLTTGKLLSARARTLLPHGLARAVFAGRGAYGQYFAHMTAAR
ncbi:hypothetical protein [Massilia sp. CCM 8734]|uniref:hypothetical protein n=1 Tax=Massilia sp. CCM 8734 TaxID=2609283 RepID=UPI0014209255|nr:hypothetical protein [Massilia sp. CCM 8734]NHZ96536.1 hypothetical protein [Massilia sp. CCM 8734]